MTIPSNAWHAKVSAERNNSNADESVKKSLRETLESPAVLNKIVNDYFIEEHGWQFLRDINFAFKSIRWQMTAEKRRLGLATTTRRTLPIIRSVAAMLISLVG